MKNKGYNGNPNLKNIGEEIAYTQEQLHEYIKCSQDPVYFVDNYCYIVTLDHGLQPFKLYDCQKNKLNVINNNRKVIIMESRQSGKTTTSAAYILWYTIFQRDRNVAIMANKAKTAQEILSRYQLMYENLPIWLQQGIKIWNKGDIELENGSKVFTAATTASGIRSKSVSLLYIDEAAIIPNNIADAFFASVYPTISSGKTSKILITSTPLGYNHFWKFWNDAQNNKNDLVSLFIPYWEIPGRDEKWAEEQRRQLGELKYNQEIECNFLGSSATLVNGTTIASLSPKYPLYSKDNLDVLEPPEKEKFYVIMVDPSAGVGQDYSAMVVIDITKTPYRIVAKYRNNEISPLIFPSIIKKIATDYNNAYVLVELNKGEQVAHILHHDIEYENLLMVSKLDSANNISGQHISGGFGVGRSQLGLTMDKRVKRIGCSQAKDLIETKKLEIFDAEIISEISTFIEQSNGSYAADIGYNDDLMMCIVMFGWLTVQPFFKELNNINLREELYKIQIDNIENQLTPFGFIEDGVNREIVNF